MSSTVTITGNNSTLESQFYPPLNLNDEWECGLLYFSAFNSIPNVTAKNNVFSHGTKTARLMLPCGAYDFYDICNYLENHLSDCKVIIKPNYNTLTCSLFCTEVVNFDEDKSIGCLLGFRKEKLEPNIWHESDTPVNIHAVSIIRIECNLIKESYINGVSSHIIHEFAPNVPPGHRFIEVPRNVIYLPINTKHISLITIKILDESGNNIDFREENIQLRLHFRRSKC